MFVCLFFFVTKERKMLLTSLLFYQMFEGPCNYSVSSNDLAHFWPGISFQHWTSEQGDPSWVLQYLWSRLMLPPWGGFLPCTSRSLSKCHINQFDFFHAILPWRWLLKIPCPCWHKTFQMCPNSDYATLITILTILEKMCFLLLLLGRVLS